MKKQFDLKNVNNKNIIAKSNETGREIQERNESGMFMFYRLTYIAETEGNITN